jgi:hypothetical protein
VAFLEVSCTSVCHSFFLGASAFFFLGIGYCLGIAGSMRLPSVRRSAVGALPASARVRASPAAPRLGVHG